MIKHCTQLRDRLKNIKALYSDYCLALEQAKTSKEYEPALGIQPALTQNILELGMKVNPDKYIAVYITEIERKNKVNIPLTKAEIIFIYYAYDFLYNAYDKVSDPRIEEILKTRNPKEDAPIVLDCEPSKIAWDAKEVTDDTQAYIGPWNPGIFQIIKNYPNITHLYESFPDKKIFMQTLETDPNISSPANAEKALKDKNIHINDWAKDMLEKTEFSQTPEVYQLVRFTVEQLGLKQGANINEIYKRAEELALEICPAEVGPQLRLKYTGREWFLIAMKQIADRDGRFMVFGLSGTWGVLSLKCGYELPGDGWDDVDEFVFRFRREDKKEK